MFIVYHIYLIFVREGSFIFFSVLVFVFAAYTKNVPAVRLCVRVSLPLNDEIWRPTRKIGPKSGHGRCPWKDGWTEDAVVEEDS